MGYVPVNRAGLTLAGVLAAWHAIWAALAVTWNCLTAFAETASARRHDTAHIGRSGRPSGAS